MVSHGLLEEGRLHDILAISVSLPVTSATALVASGGEVGHIALGVALLAAKDRRFGAQENQQNFVGRASQNGETQKYAFPLRESNLATNLVRGGGGQNLRIPPPLPETPETHVEPQRVALLNEVTLRVALLHARQIEVHDLLLELHPNAAVLDSRYDT